MTPLEGLDPVGAWLVPALAFHFPLTWITWIVCLTVACLNRRRLTVTAARPLPTLRQARLPPDDSHIWVMPVYVWGYESSTRFSHELSYIGVAFSLVVLYEIFFALFVLVVVQTLAVMALRGDARTLGLDGLRHTAAVAVILTLFLQISLYFMVTRL